MEFSYLEKGEKVKPLLRGHFHQAMFFMALGASYPLIIRCDTPKELISITIYCVCALFMFGVSTLYHRVNWPDKRRFLWKKLDHSGIFLMIAGSFTPVATLGLSEETAFKCLLTIWIVAFIGIIQSVFFVMVPKYVSSLIYIFAGYLILPYLPELKQNIGIGNIWLIVVGGILYSVGAIFYALRWPKFRPAVFSYHEMFHIFVNLGAAVHFAMINSLVN